MRAALALCFLLPSCALQTWTAPQPYFRTRQPDGAWARAVAATKEHCGGVRNVNEEAGVVVGPWVGWNTGDGLVLTQCLVTLLRGDEHVIDVRVTFAVRRCPLSSMDDLEALAPTCERTDLVSEQVKNGLEVTAQKLEADLTR